MEEVQKLLLLLQKQKIIVFTYLLKKVMSCNSHQLKLLPFSSIELVVHTNNEVS